MKKIFDPTRQGRDFPAIFWFLASLILAIVLLQSQNLSNSFILSVIIIVFANMTNNLIRIFLLNRVKRSIILVVNRSVIQSAVLIFSAFAPRLLPDNTRIYWLGLGAFLLMFLVTQLSLFFIQKRFINIKL